MGDGSISLKVLAACNVLSDENIYKAILNYQFDDNGHAERHLKHWRNGGGADLEVDLFKLVSENLYITWCVNDVLWQWDKSHVHGWGYRNPGDKIIYPFPQGEFSSTDWQQATGSINLHIVSPPDVNSRDAQLSFSNIYRFHPNEKRKTQCIHQALERLKTKGARDYTMRGSTGWQLTWPCPRNAAEVAAMEVGHQASCKQARATRISGGW